MKEIHTKAFLIAMGHFALSVIAGFGAYAIAFGSALSDTYTESSGIRLPELLLMILQAPVYLVHWVVKHYSADGKSGLNLSGVFLVGLLSSILYGYVIAYVFFRGRTELASESEIQ
jgi:ribose/xylose/arabinose/galactoside ABC-type transport system permease subunit